MPARQRIKLILNPAAGSGAALRVISKIQKFLRELGANFDLEVTSGPKQATQISRRAVRAGYTTVVAVGGDGTVNEVATSLVGTEVALGVIPLGNGNDFFRITGIDLDLSACCKAISERKCRRIDVGSLGDKSYFFNALGVGLNATVAKSTGENHLLRGVLLYLYATVRSIPSYQASQMKVTIEDYEQSGITTLVAVGNGTSTGGGFRLTPFASPYDGLFDICWIQAVSKSRMFYYLPRVLKGKLPNLSSVKTFRGRKVEIQSDTPFTAHIDGEILGTGLDHLEANILPKRLKVICKA